MYIKQFNIYKFDLSKDTYCKENNILYGLVISPNEMNECLASVIIAPLCNECAITPTTFLIDDITRVKLDQITTIAKASAIKSIDKISFQKIKKIRETLEEMFIKE